MIFVRRNPVSLLLPTKLVRGISGHFHWAQAVNSKYSARDLLYIELTEQFVLKTYSERQRQMSQISGDG
jgi:hypothetical protein